MQNPGNESLGELKLRADSHFFATSLSPLSMLLCVYEGNHYSRFIEVVSQFLLIDSVHNHTAFSEKDFGRHYSKQVVAFPRFIHRLFGLFSDNLCSDSCGIDWLRIASLVIWTQPSVEMKQAADCLETLLNNLEPSKLDLQSTTMFY